MMSLITLAVISVIAVIGSSSAVPLPPTFQKCDPNEDQAQFNECLRAAINGGIRQFTKDDNKLGFTNFEPLHIPKLIIGEGTGPVQVVQNYFNVNVEGYSKFDVAKVDFDLDKKVLRIEGTYPKLLMRSDYSANGKILVLPIQGEGKAVITLTKLHAVNTFTLKEKVKKGEKYFVVDDCKVEFRPELIHFNLGNLFNGDKLLGETMNTVLNDNWKEVFEDVRGSYEEAFAALDKQIANKFFSKIPVTDIFA